MERWLAHAIFQPTLAYNYLLARVLGVRRWWDSVGDSVIIGALPFRSDAARLQETGVTGVVNMCEEYAGPITEYERLGIEQLRLPTVDFTHPSAEYVQRGADFIQRHAQRGGCTYVHCKAGRARSATVVLWWLVRYCGMTPQQAQTRLTIVRPHVNPRVYLRPVIQELYQRLNSEQPAGNRLGTNDEN